MQSNHIQLVCKITPVLVHEKFAFDLTRRFVGTFVRVTGNTLWNSTSPEARRTGRGKRARLRRREDFSGKHSLGEGKAGILWPGLNTSIQSKAMQRTPEEQEKFEAEKNDEKQGKRSFKRPVVRGWTGAHFPGIHLGPPDAVHGQNFADFDSVIMDVARVSHMNQKVGRVYGTRAMVAVGNGKGLVGVSSCVAPNVAGAFRKARNKAAARLIYVERLEDRTVFEDIYVNHHRTWLSIRKQPSGYGLRCHRALRDMCKLIGFQDMYIKVTGSTTMLNLLKCFIKGVLSQETYQQKADRLGYHVVEFDELRRNYPVVLASPSGEVKTESHDDYDEYLNQELIVRDVNAIESGRINPFSTVIATDNRGPPVPASRSVPAFLNNIRDMKLD